MNELALLTPAITSTIIAAAVSISVVFLGRRSELISQRQALKTSAYVDFIRGIAGLAIVQRDSIRSKEHFIKEWELEMLVADAKARIAIYASKPVVSALAIFLRGGAHLDSPERTDEFTKVCQKMRRDRSLKFDEVTDQEAHYLLFGGERQA